MATKGQITEQVLRIVNGGNISDDSKVTIQEVGVLLEHERDALVRKNVLENSLMGEHEIPSEFVSVHRLDLETDKMYGTSGRPYVKLKQTPINLPNDGSIYKVCKVANSYTKELIDEYTITVPNIAGGDSSVYGNVYASDTDFKTRTGTHNLGKKLILSFTHGNTSTTTQNYQFSFDYIDNNYQYDSNTLTESNIKPSYIINSLNSNNDFAEFLRARELTVNYKRVAGATYPNHFIFQGYSNTQYYFTSVTIKSVLTNGHVVDINTTTSTTISAGSADILDEIGFGVQIYYPKNKRLRELEGDNLGIKGKGSSVLNAVVNLTKEELINASASSYAGVTGINLAKMWVNKNASTLKLYGVSISVNAANITIKEENPLGGFQEILSIKNGLTSAVSQTNVDGESSERANYREVMCYSRMPNPGMYSNMYDNAINLSGRKYWYRQEGRLYLYNENQDNSIDIGLSGNNDSNVETKIAVWMLAKSKELKFEDEFPLPANSVSEVIKSLVATFTAMRAAKEDVINDNLDIV